MRTQRAVEEAGREGQAEVRRPVHQEQGAVREGQEGLRGQVRQDREEEEEEEQGQGRQEGQAGLRGRGRRGRRRGMIVSQQDILSQTLAY